MYRTLKDFITEDLEYYEIQNIIKNDIKHLRLSDDSLVIHKAKEMLYKIITNDEEKYHNIIDIIKIQNETNDFIGREPRAKYTNVEYLSTKSAFDVKTIKTKWEEIKQSVFKDEV